MTIHDWSRVDPGIFHDFNYSWVFRIRDALNSGVLPSEYYALVEQRAGGKEPDVVTLHHSESDDVAEGIAPDLPGASQAATLTVATAPPKVAYVEELDDEFYVRKRRSIAIRHVSGDDLVALVEIMSPGNKSSKSHLQQFLEKIVIAIQAGALFLSQETYVNVPLDETYRAAFQSVPRHLRALLESPAA